MRRSAGAIVEVAGGAGEPRSGGTGQTEAIPSLGGIGREQVQPLGARMVAIDVRRHRLGRLHRRQRLQGGGVEAGNGRLGTSVWIQGDQLGVQDVVRLGTRPIGGIIVQRGGNRAGRSRMGRAQDVLDAR